MALFDYFLLQLFRHIALLSQVVDYYWDLMSEYILISTEKEETVEGIKGYMQCEGKTLLCGIFVFPLYEHMT